MTINSVLDILYFVIMVVLYYKYFNIFCCFVVCLCETVCNSNARINLN